MHNTIKYRPDVDGLRALSVIIVILFHFEIPGFTGGFVGVDIFFIISGYLISSILLRELSTGSFSFVKFYERRIRRILPALFFMLFFVIVFAYFLFDFISFKDTGKTLMSIVLYYSNLYFYSTINDYFAAPNNPFLHTWSLSVEEQFYIFFPSFLWLIYKFQRRYLNYYLLFTAAASFAYCIICVHTNQTLAFFSPVSRAWQLIAGALLSVKLYPTIKSKILNESLALLGLGLVLVALFTLSASTTYPTYNSLLPIIGGCLIIHTGQSNTLLSKALSVKWVVFIGKISYSLYLWHWVIWIGLKTIKVPPYGFTEIVILLIVTLLCGYLSWRFVEQPFRDKQKLFSNRNNLFLATAGVSMVIFVIGFYIQRKDGMHIRTQDTMMVEIADQDKKWMTMNSFYRATERLAVKKKLPKVGNKAVEPEYLLWGDSHAKALVGGFEAAAIRKKVSIYFAGARGTPALSNVHRLNRLPDAGVIAKNVIKFIASHPKIKTVFLAGRWNFYSNNKDQSLIMQDDLNPEVRDNKGNFEKGLKRTIKALRALKRKVVVITDAPELDAMPVVYINERNIFRNVGNSLNELGPPREDYYKLNNDGLKFFEQLQKDSLVEILPIQEHFFVKGKLLVEENGHLMFRDENHISSYASKRLENVMYNALK